MKLKNKNFVNFNLKLGNKPVGFYLQVDFKSNSRKMIRRKPDTSKQIDVITISANYRLNVASAQ